MRLFYSSANTPCKAEDAPSKTTRKRTVTSASQNAI